MDFFTLPQIIGYVAYCTGIYAGLQKKDNRLFLLFSLTSALFCVHYFLLNQLTGASSQAVIAVRMFLNRRYKGAVIAFPFAAIALFFGWKTYQTPYSLLPLAAVLCATFGAAYFSGIKLRLVFASCCVFWLIHDIHAGSNGGIAQDITTMSVHLLTCYRLRKAEQNSKK